jgi:integrase
VTLNRTRQDSHPAQIIDVHWWIVQERLGHADIAMTLNRSSHVKPDMQRSAADTLDAAFMKVS